MSVAVDFTASNGELHHLSDDPSVLNDYETSILEVGKILEPYAYRSKFAGFGFGGIPRYQNILKVNHCFNLNGKLDPTITGLDEMLNEYRRAVRGTEMWGPTLFAPMLRKIREFTDFNTTRMYYVLLILTDGCIHDMRETIDQIVECSSQPLSIIIVGVGDADFSAMNLLDSDDLELVDGDGNIAQRDIV